MGVRVALADRFADGGLDILTRAGPGSESRGQVFDWRTLANLDRFLAHEAGMPGGVFVG